MGKFIYNIGMLPISFTQTKFLNPLNIIKAFLWFLLRSFQLNNQNKYEKKFIEKLDKSEFVNLSIPNDIRVVTEIEEDSLILVGKFKPSIFLKYLFSLKKVRLIDKDFFLSSEASTRFRLHYYDFSTLEERERYTKISKNNFQELKKTRDYERIALLGTGPSFEEARDYFQVNNLEVVACNSAIYDKELWNGGCKVFCFADPVFHFGNSKEAKRFKNQVIKRFQNENFFIICPIVAFPILVNNWKIDERYIIGFQPSNSNLKLGDEENLLAPNSSNILTELMIPAASILSKEIYLGGFDGREKSEKNFWQYSNKTHQTLDEHRENHPSFFNDRNIKKYYKRHIDILNDQIINLEKIGYQFHSVTKSNIDILNRRLINE